MDVSFIYCFSDRQAAQDKANGFSDQGFSVCMIDGTNAIIFDDLVSEAKVVGSSDDLDWTVVIATHKTIIQTA